jgi:hypothetical protein
MPDGSVTVRRAPQAALPVYDVVAVPVLLHRGGALHANPAMLRLLGCTWRKPARWTWPSW